jgi:hypothetical protein
MPLFVKTLDLNIHGLAGAAEERRERAIVKRAGTEAQGGSASCARNAVGG